MTNVAEGSMARPNLRISLLILLGALFSGLPLDHPLSAADRPAVTHTPVFRGKARGTDVQIIVWDTEYAPGAVNPRHLHPAAVTFHVLSGTGIWQEEGKPPVTLHAGDTLFAPAGTIHSHRNPSATEKLRFLELIAAPEAKDRAIPQP
jgi:quercetin dioxygenase-like cupin family protein